MMTLPGMFAFPEAAEECWVRGVAKLLTKHSFIMAAERSPRVTLGTRWPRVPSLSHRRD